MIAGAGLEGQFAGVQGDALHGDSGLLRLAGLSRVLRLVRISSLARALCLAGGGGAARLRVLLRLDQVAGVQIGRRRIVGQLIQQSGHLSAGEESLRIQVAVGVAAHDLIGHQGGSVLGSPVGEGGAVAELIQNGESAGLAGDAQERQGLVQNGESLLPGDIRGGSQGAIPHAGGQTVGLGPGHSGVVVVGGGYVSKGGGGGDGRLTRRAVEHQQKVAPADVQVRAELSV